jgi:hypothetical protein
MNAHVPTSRFREEARTLAYDKPREPFKQVAHLGKLALQHAPDDS